MVANVELFELLCRLRLPEVPLPLLHLLLNVLVLQRAWPVPVLVNPPKSKVLRSLKNYVLADEGVRCFETGVVKLEQVVLPQFVQLQHAVFGHGCLVDVHPGLKLDLIHAVISGLSPAQIRYFGNGLRDLFLFQVLNTVLQILFYHFHSLHLLNFPLCSRQLVLVLDSCLLLLQLLVLALYYRNVFCVQLLSNTRLQLLQQFFVTATLFLKSRLFLSDLL